MDTSMGFTPLAGLMMGTRCGSVDPSVVGFACETLGKTVEEVMSDFNSRSGLKGMVDDGDSYDMRALLQRKQDGDPKATLALDMFLYRLAQHIAASMIALQGPLDALVFTAGIGEHSAEIRQRTMELLKPVLPQVELDEDRNNNDGDGSMGVLSKEGTWPLVLDIPTDEEAMIGCECLRLLKKNSY
jgi:acetate kinase